MNQPWLSVVYLNPALGPSQSGPLAECLLPGAHPGRLSFEFGVLT
jgi:hypothetical protein